MRTLVRAVGGPRYVVALTVDSIGAGLLRPFMLLYGIDVLHLAAVTAGLAMAVGVITGLGGMPLVGRWLDRGARSTAVAASMLVRAIGTVLLLAAPAGHAATVWLFAVAALLLGMGGQAVSAAHGALVVTLTAGRKRDAALAASRSLRNAWPRPGRAGRLRQPHRRHRLRHALAAGTAVSYVLAAGLTSSVRIRASAPPAGTRNSTSRGTGPARASTPYCRSPHAPAAHRERHLRLLPQHSRDRAAVRARQPASCLAGVGGGGLRDQHRARRRVPGTGDRLDVPVSRRSALAFSGVVISISYLGFFGSVELPHRWAIPAIVGVSVLSTLGEAIYACSSRALVAATAPEHAVGSALAWFQLSTGFGLAISPAIITALAAGGPAALWLSFTAATLLASAAVARLPAAEA